MIWKFTLDGVDIDEPVGFSDLSLNVIRDDVWHGVFFEASNNMLGFYGDAYNIIKSAKESKGIDAIVIFSALSKCEGQAEFSEVISGKLNFTNMQETCGNECMVKLSVEQDSCAMTFKNRFDQKVNIDSNIAFDKVTLMPEYSGLKLTLELPTQNIPISADANVVAEGDGITIENNSFYGDSDNLFIRPVYGDVRDNSILTGEMDTPANFYEDTASTFLLTPQILLSEIIDCINNEFEYSVRLKGFTKPDVVADPGATILIRLVMDLWDGNGNHDTDGIEIHSHEISSTIDDGMTYNFDEEWSGSLSIPQGFGVYVYLQYSLQEYGISPTILNITYNFSKETSFLMTNTKSCPPTDSGVYLINETLARVTEAITDSCLTVQSDYYGRTDSQPYSSSIDGCGGLRVFTSGLKIRNAEDKSFFASMKELMEGLSAIDNIGMGIYSDRVRVEQVRWFYKDNKIMDLPSIPSVKSTVIQSLVYSTIKCGYEKWEIKSIKGLDEFNSPKEFRTSIKSVSNAIDLKSKLVTSGYIIESTRTQPLLYSGSADSTYDNDIFLICVKRDGYGYHVEQGVIESGSNLYSPGTAYNWRVRPMYNLMRWFKSIAQSYVVLSNPESKIFFTSGAGNYLAEGMLSVYDNCRIENKVLPENHDLSIADFDKIDEATPIYKPEIISFDYPLSVDQYNYVKENPYGYFNVQCGDGYFFKAYIKNISYKPVEGIAEFTLIKAWQ